MRPRPFHLRDVLITGWLTCVDRICPGRHLADSSLFIVCASILLVFNITPELDARGKPMPLEPKFTKHLSVSYVSDRNLD